MAKDNSNKKGSKIKFFDDGGFGVELEDILSSPGGRETILEIAQIEVGNDKKSTHTSSDQDKRGN